MISEEELLAALEKPIAVYPLLKLIEPSTKSPDALQDRLMRLRAEGKVKFNIKSGKWSRA